MSQIFESTGMVRGWCPGALRPMESGDGLIVRVRPRGGALSLDALEALLEEAQRCGNGIVEITRRANLQLRGVRANELPRLHAVLRDHDLLDDHADQETVRNILLSPLSGVATDDVFDMRPTARALERHLRDDKLLWRLPAKFGFLLDSGAQPGLYNERADVRVKARRLASGQISMAIGIDRASGLMWLGQAKSDDPACLAALLVKTATSLIEYADAASTPVTRTRRAPEFIIQQIQAQMAQDLETPALAPTDCSSRTPSAPLDRILGVHDGAAGRQLIGAAAPFGSLEATCWQKLVAHARSAGAIEIRVTPWRAIVVPMGETTDAQSFLTSISQAGFITDASNPLLCIDACPGIPFCSSANAQTRTDAGALARVLANYGNIRSVHISGCAKGCARSASADCLLVAEAGGYAVSFNAAHSETDAPIIPFYDVARGLELADKERTKRA